MSDPRNLSTVDFNYELPPGRIAFYPSEQRDESRLLICRNNEPIRNDKFSSLGEYIPEGSLLVLNNTKVLHARLVFRKESGSRIEVFCLNPVNPVSDIQLAFGQKKPVSWNCLIGNSKRWKSGVLKKEGEISGQKVSLFAERIDGIETVKFSWEPAGFSFSEVVDCFGDVPLPPYISRETDSRDNERYQTVFADPMGSVAAPTAGLHFTSELFDKLKERDINTGFLTLHVGAGTFRPLSAELIGGHEMHSEEVFFNRDLLLALQKETYSKLYAVGTTSMRSLETIYWLGVKASAGELDPNCFNLNQWEAYDLAAKDLITRRESLDNLLLFMDKNGIAELRGFTKLMIAPSYRFMMADGLVTNFHQPGSTLLLLVSALIGDRWKEAYAYALDNDFRFLSYGDACLFEP